MRGVGCDKNDEHMFSLVNMFVFTLNACLVFTIYIVNVTVLNHFLNSKFFKTDRSKFIRIRKFNFGFFFKSKFHHKYKIDEY